MDENKPPPKPTVPAPRPTASAPVAPRRIVMGAGGKPAAVQPSSNPTKPAEKKVSKSPLEDPDNRKHLDHFIFEHAPLISRQIRKLKAKGQIPSSVDQNDLIVAGVNGIMHAAHRYDPKTGVPFANFANTHIASRILDHIVASGDIPKELMVQAKRVAAYKQRMEAKKQAEAAAAVATPPSEAPGLIKPDAEDDAFFDEPKEE